MCREYHHITGSNRENQENRRKVFLPLSMLFSPYIVIINRSPGSGDNDQLCDQSESDITDQQRDQKKGSKTDKKHDQLESDSNNGKVDKVYIRNYRNIL